MSSPWLSASDAQHSTSDDNAWATTAASSSQHIRSRKSSFQTSSRPDGVDDPWSDRQPSASTGHLRARKSFLTPSRAEVVDRHPLRSPSPGQAGARPEATRRPSAVAAEWKAISNGLAGLFGGSSTSTEYSWPPDPSSSSSQPHVDDEANKGRVESTLGKLENWFGLQPPPSQRAQSASASTSTSAANEREVGDGQVRVLIHPVSSADTLASLALHYGADIQVLRKANRLWPGDPVQIRKSIYVPVDSCKHRPPNANIRVMHTKEGAVDPTLAFVPKEDDDLLTGTPLEELVPGLPGGADPVASFMPETNKAYSQEAFATSLSRTGSVKSLTPALRALNQAHSSSAGAGAGAGRGGGSSIAASATSGGFVPPQQPLHVAKVPADQLRFFPTDAPPTAGKSGIDDLLSTTPNGAERPTLSRAVSSSTSAMDDEEEWKPNTWHFGRPVANTNTSTNSNTEAEGYRGWNDAPPPPNAVVARAYTQPRQSHHRLLNDLAAGLPANPGAASKWARPIQFGDSLPSNSTTATAPKERKGGLGRLLDDTIRGRISVERALGNAFETTSRQLAPPPRPSAASGPPPASRPPPPAASQSSGLQDAPIAAKVDGGVIDRGGSTVARRNRSDRTKSKDD